MNIRDLIPWGHSRREPWSRGGRDVVTRRDDDPMRALQWDINRVFDDFWRRFELPMLGGDGGRVAELMPRVDVRETDNEVEVVAELPGMQEADVDVSVAEGMLTIRGEKRSEREEREEGNGYIVRERSFGRIERLVPLPEGLDLDSAEATFKNGVLTVRIAKTAEAQRAAKRIQVQRG
jgi:HSP20 family protein